MEYPYNEIFSNKSEQITDRHNMNKSQNQWKKLGKQIVQAVWSHLHKILENGN